MRRSQSPPRRLRACVACTKARAQCHFQPENVERHLCNRCERLGRVCEAKTESALRRPRRVRGVRESADDEPGDLSVVPKVVLMEGIQETKNTSGRSSSRSDGYSADLPFDLTTSQAAHILQIYRTKYNPNFPFIPIIENVHTELFYQLKPMTFRSIMLVAAPLPANRVEIMKNEVLGSFGSKLLVEDSRTLDVLQGLLICIAWAKINNLCDERVTTLTYMALGLAHTLGITKIPLPILRGMDKDKKSAEDVRKGGKGDTRRTQPHSLQEQRAYLGLYFVLSTNSIHFGRKNPLDGAYVPHCLESILSASECPTDSALVHLIRMTQLSERISSPNLSERDTEAYADLVEGRNRGVRAELDSLRESIADIQDFDGQGKDVSEMRRKYFELGYHCLLARLSEPATHLPDILASGGTASAHRSLRLQSCLDAVIEYFGIMLSLPPESLLYQSLAFSEQASFILVLATRLCANTAGAKDWNVDKVRKKLDMTVTIERLVAQMRDSETIEKGNIARFAEEFGLVLEEHEHEETGHWGTMAKRMWNIGAWFDKMSKGDSREIETSAEVNELLYRVGEGGRVGGQTGSAEADGPSWLGLLPMGNLGWRFDDI